MKKSKIGVVGLIGLLLAGGLFLAGCETEAKAEDITITITGDFSEYIGWEANIGLYDDDGNDVAAVALPLEVRANTAPLPFTMLAHNAKPFNKPGMYMVIFWFEKDDMDDANFVIMSKRINKGDNSIAFSTFSRY